MSIYCCYIPGVVCVDTIRRKRVKALSDLSLFIIKVVSFTYNHDIRPLFLKRGSFSSNSITIRVSSPLQQSPCHLIKITIRLTQIHQELEVCMHSIVLVFLYLHIFIIIKSNRLKILEHTHTYENIKNKCFLTK